jgi:hypothetical protein
MCTKLAEEPDVENRQVRFREGCALQAHGVRQPQMVALVKPSQQPGTESCVVGGNACCEA